MTVIAEAGGRKISQFLSLCPDVDVLGINSYAGLPSLPRRLAELGMDRPYVITEFGPQGPWEVGKTRWGAPIEPTSTEKAKAYLAEYTTSISGQAGRCLGSYAFLWGHKQEATATWFGMFLPSGERLGAVDAMTLAWTGKSPANRAPEIKEVATEAREAEVSPGARFTAKLDAPTRKATRSSSAGKSDRRASTGKRGAIGRPSPRRIRSASSRRRAWTRPSGRPAGPGLTGSSPTCTTAREARRPRTCRSR